MTEFSDEPPLSGRARLPAMLEPPPEDHDVREDERPPEALLEFAERARAYITRAIGMPVAYDAVSLAAADHYLATANGLADAKEGGGREPIFELLISTVGAFFGEVVRHELRGRWSNLVGAGGLAPAAEWVMSVGALHFTPAGVVAEAIHGEAATGFDGSIQSQLGLRARPDRALAGAPPVTAEYFYSLTGKYETLERMLELVAGIEAAAKARGPNNPERDPDDEDEEPDA
jgi:hypothetical protein